MAITLELYHVFSKFVITQEDSDRRPLVRCIHQLQSTGCGEGREDPHGFLAYELIMNDLFYRLARLRDIYKSKPDGSTRNVSPELYWDTERG